MNSVNRVLLVLCALSCPLVGVVLCYEIDRQKQERGGEMKSLDNCISHTKRGLWCPRMCQGPEAVRVSQGGRGAESLVQA